MFGWLTGVLGWTISGVDDLWKKVIAVIQSVVSYIDSYVNQLIGDINSVWQWLNTFVTQINKFIDSVYTSIYNWALKSLTNVTNWVNGLYNTLRTSVIGVVSWVTSWIDRIYSDITGYIQQLENWVLKNIWDPLYNSISGIVHWIDTYGVWVVYLLTNPDQLALLLGRYILGAWLSLGHKYARPIAQWLGHALLSMAGDVAGVLEDIIADIL